MERGRRPVGRRAARDSSEPGWILMLVALLVATLLLLHWSASAQAGPDSSKPTAGPAPLVEGAPSPSLEPTPEPTPPVAALESELFLQAATRRSPVATQAPRQRRVALQAGHWRMDERPEELAWMEPSAAAYGELEEHELNLRVARLARRLLARQGIAVDLLGVTVPPGYVADAFVAIHADHAETPAARGWKISPPWRASAASRELAGAVARDYAAGTGLPESAGPITNNMRGYYAFNYQRFSHAIAPTTPAIIVELGFMSSAEDRAVLIDHPELAAAGLADGIMRFLGRADRRAERDYLPVQMPELQTYAAQTALYDGPEEDAAILSYLEPGRELAPYDVAGGAYLIAVRGDWRTVGWVRAADVEEPGPLAHRDGVRTAPMGQLGTRN